MKFILLSALSAALVSPALSAQDGIPVTAGADAACLNGTPGVWWLVPCCAVIALLFAFICYRLMMKAPKGNERMEEIAGYVREGAMAYLKQQYSKVGMVFVIMF